jgi:hypothetical protein
VGDAEHDSSGALHAVSFDFEREGTLHGQLSIEGSRLEAQVDSEARARLVRNEIESRLESRVRYRTEHLEPVPGADASEDAPDWSSPELRQLVARHWREWIDRPLEARANETPRQAAKTERGRERLRRLLAIYRETGAEETAPFGGPDRETLELLGLGER